MCSHGAKEPFLANENFGVALMDKQAPIFLKLVSNRVSLIVNKNIYLSMLK